jgi:hypothetical protein
MVEVVTRMLNTMKTLKSFAAVALLAAAASVALLGCKSDAHSNMSSSAAKPYPMNKCLVSGEALKAGEVYTFVRDGQEIKLCCKDCLVDFDKDPGKFLAKLDQAK